MLEICLLTFTPAKSHVQAFILGLSVHGPTDGSASGTAGRLRRQKVLQLAEVRVCVLFHRFHGFPWLNFRCWTVGHCFRIAETWLIFS